MPPPRRPLPFGGRRSGLPAASPPAEPIPDKRHRKGIAGERLGRKEAVPDSGERGPAGGPRFRRENAIRRRRSFTIRIRIFRTSNHHKLGTAASSARMRSKANPAPGWSSQQAGVDASRTNAIRTFVPHRGPPAVKDAWRKSPRCVSRSARGPTRNRASATLPSWPLQLLRPDVFRKVVRVPARDVVSFEEHGVIHELAE